MAHAQDAPLLGIFVGGASRRMGGRPKGRLRAPNGGLPIVVELVAAGRAAGLAPVLVGDARPYEDLVPDVRRIADDPVGVGPLGGLSALFALAGERQVVVVACDMPHVEAADLRMLVDHPSGAAVVAPRRGEAGPFEPLFARYDPARVREPLRRALASGVRSFQRLLGDLWVEALPVDAHLTRVLTDWDTPADLL